MEREAEREGERDAEHEAERDVQREAERRWNDITTLLVDKPSNTLLLYSTDTWLLH